MHRTRLTIATLIVSVLSACSNGSDVTAPAESNLTAVATPSGGPLDDALRAAIIAQSTNGTLDDFQFPKPNQLDRIPQDPKNPLTPQKVKLGSFLYHETAMGVDNVRAEGYETYSCASCHHVQGGFMANRAQGMGEGAAGFGVAGEVREPMPGYDDEGAYPDCQPIRTPTALNSAYQELMLWNGQFGAVADNLGTEDRWTPGTPLESNHLGYHGLETQAHAGLKVHRMSDIEFTRVADIGRYGGLFRAAFPHDAEPINRLNAALAIAAYERTLLANEAPFQRWLRGDTDAMTTAQKRGAIVFFGSGGCVACHDGPALNSMTFHALGMNDLDGSYDMTHVVLDPFGGTVPDATRRGRGGFTGNPDDDYAFKTPQLYNLTDSPFYGHGASFASVREVIEYKNAAVPENALVPADRLSATFVPLGLTTGEIDDLVAFIEEGLYDPALARYVPARLPSGNCFPVNDPQAQLDLGCDADPPLASR